MKSNRITKVVSFHNVDNYVNDDPSTFATDNHKPISDESINYSIDYDKIDKWVAVIAIISVTSLLVLCYYASGI